MSAGPVDRDPITLAVVVDRLDRMGKELDRIRDNLESRRPDIVTVLAVIIAAAALAVNAVPALAA